MNLIQTNFINTEEQKEQREIFMAMDTDFDGKLTREELLEGFTKLGNPNPEEEVDRIMKVADFDDNGTIEFSEFCTASMDKRKMLSNQRLKAAFDMFDTDGSGQISFEEVKKLLGHGKMQDNNTFKEMVNEMDRDGNGEIDF